MFLDLRDRFDREQRGFDCVGDFLYIRPEVKKRRRDEHLCRINTVKSSLFRTQSEWLPA